MPQYFPTERYENLVICASGVGVTKDYSCIITNINPDHELIGKCQCFPLYWYEENKNKQKTLLLFSHFYSLLKLWPLDSHGKLVQFLP